VSVCTVSELVNFLYFSFWVFFFAIFRNISQYFANNSRKSFDCDWLKNQEESLCHDWWTGADTEPGGPCRKTENSKQQPNNNTDNNNNVTTEEEEDEISPPPPLPAGHTVLLLGPGMRS